MARIGQFQGPAEVYGTPLSTVHPPDNNVAAARFHPLLAAMGLTEAEMDDLQAQIDELFALLRLIPGLGDA